MDTQDKILDAIDALTKIDIDPTVTRVTKVICGAWYTLDDAKAVGRMVGDMVEDGLIRWSGIHIYRKGV